jgi:hypothetical protein
MQDSNKNQSNVGNKNLNQPKQPNQKPIQSPGSQGQEGKDRKFTNNSDIKQPGKNPTGQPTQQDRSTKR